MSNKSWSFLEPGDIVDIVAPSSSVPTDDLTKYYKNARNILDKIGLVARIPSDLILKTEDPFSANTLDYRTSHFINALNDPTSKAIWAIRGGYGAAKLIPFLENLEEPIKPKLLLGFSDITALHLFINKKWHWPSMHSAVINQLIVNPKFADELSPILFGQQQEIKYDQLIPLNDVARQSRLINAKITGGNLSLIQTSLATTWQIDSENKIVFIEEVGEKGYRIDRILNHLLQAGVFNNAKAVIFGEITTELEKDGTNLCPIAIRNFANTIDIPVLSLPIIGHNNIHNSPLPLGTSCQLVLGENYILTCPSGGKF